MARSCFRYFSFTSFNDVERLTPYEYRLMMEGLELRKLDEEYAIEKLAYDTFRASSTKSQGKTKRVPVYKTFKSFFDYEKRLKQVKRLIKKEKQENQWSNWSNYLKRKKGGEN